MPYGALTLHAGWSTAGVALPVTWHCSRAATGTGEQNAAVALDDTGWEQTDVPGQHAATEGICAIWYRVRFARPDAPAARWLLRFRGAFQSTAVWLNGRLLGQHYGYFAPFGFDITEDVEAENLLAVCCEARVEEITAAKKHPMGVFNDWDCRPYPNGARGLLEPEPVWSLPLGLWAPVDLIGTGPVIMQQVHYTPSLQEGGGAFVRVVARLANLSEAPVAGSFTAALSSEKLEDQDSVAFRLAPHQTAEVTLNLRVAQPRLWWPWTHGEPYRYTATGTVMVNGQVSMCDTAQIGLRTVEYRGESAADGPAWLINGRPIFPKGSNYICDFRLDTCTYERHRADLLLLRGANMDMVRVHAHVEPESFYQACDELGVLVICDSVLNGSYAYGARPEDRLFFDWAATDQVEKMIGLLYNHPSVVAWLIHNEPPWPAPMWWFGEPHRSRACREEDRNCTLRARALDPERPVITASGEKDAHTYGGWYHGTWLHFREVAPRFVTEYGAQALPAVDSPVWAHLSQGWPVRATEPSWLWAGYQPEQWARFGVGAPEQFESLQAYATASQQYQAWIARYGAERFRLLKGRPCGGALHFMLVDGHPAITWAVIDYVRRPKAAYYALRDAFSPTHLCIDPAGSVQTDRLGRILFPAGVEAGFDLWLVNDDPKVGGAAELTWVVEGAGLQGELALVIPAYSQPAVLVSQIRWTPPAHRKTEVIVRTTVRHRGQILDQNELRAMVG